MNGKSRRAGAFSALIAALCVLHMPVASAGNESGAIEPGWFAYSDGLIFLFLSATHVSSPCSNTERWAIDPSTPAGKIHFTVFLTAAASGRTIALVGSNTCAHSNTEYVATITVLD